MDCLVAAPSSAMKSFAFSIEKKCDIFFAFLIKNNIFVS